ncbi:MAG: hypothetical protein VX335_00480 [Pseudomonadota bacterium]|nr:hypothetical protein [Pseudomonadota bacterium]
MSQEVFDKPPLIFYTISYVAAFIIGIDCAINAYYYLSILPVWLSFMSNIYVVSCCAAAGFILNFILYKKDFPEQFYRLFQQLFGKTGTKKKLSVNELSFTLISELVAISSAFIMFCFTLNSYKQLALAHISAPIMIILALSYAIGTYGLLRKAINREDFNHDIKLIFKNGKKSSRKNIMNILLTFTLTTILATATWFTILTFQSGSLSILGSSIIIQRLVDITSALIWIGEIFFVFSASTYIVNLLTSERDSQKNINYTLFATFMLLAVLNALGNAAVTIASSSSLGMILGPLGAILSFCSMFGASMEISTLSDISNETPELEKKNNTENFHAFRDSTLAIISIFSGWVLSEFSPTLIANNILLSKAFLGVSFVMLLITVYYLFYFFELCSTPPQQNTLHSPDYADTSSLATGKLQPSNISKKTKGIDGANPGILKSLG